MTPAETALTISTHLAVTLPPGEWGFATTSMLVARVGGRVRVLAVMDRPRTAAERRLHGKIAAAGWPVVPVRSLAEAGLVLAPLYARARQRAQAVAWAVEAPVRRVA
jgi:hypothetical protein